MDKKLIIPLFAVLAVTSAASAQTTPRWIRQCAISPNGQTIAFAWQGDIFTVSATGGDALQITSNPAYDADPLWAPDGRTIYFSSVREGSKDVWSVPATGGAPVRLTTFNGSETPLAAWKDVVYFSSSIQNDLKSGAFPGESQTYTVNVRTGKVGKYCSTPMAAMSVNTMGIVLYEDYKGYEDPLRKHHTSSVTRDIWQYLPRRGVYRKLTTFEGEDRNPAFSGNGTKFYYLSEKSGSFNVWAGSTESDSTWQVSHFSPDPVRSLSVSDRNLIAFSYNGDVYTMLEGLDARKVDITVTKDRIERESELRSVSGGVTAAALSPNGKEMAVVSHGDVFVTSLDYKTTRRITNTPEQERNVCFSEDGRTLYYSAERDGCWSVWKTEISDKDEKYFCYCNGTKESRVTRSGETCFDPKASPDGKHIAYLRDRTELVMKNCRTGVETSLLKGVNYSYADGDLEFEWSPCGRYILTTYMADGGWNNTDVAVIDVKSGKVTDLTQSGYTDGNFRWALGGKAMTWTSDRRGYRSHGSWGAEDDVFLMFFDSKAYADFLRDKEDVEMDKLLKDKKELKKEEKDSVKAEKAPLDFSGVEDRTVTLTPFPGRLGDHYLTADGKKLYFCCRLETGQALCCKDVKEGGVEVIRKDFNCRFVPSADGKTVLAASGSGIFKMNPESGKLTPVTFQSDYDYKASEERAYIFEHVWKQVSEKFYDKGIHGADWKRIHDNYAQFLPYITNNYDFKDLLSEMLGELNGSHTGARYYVRKSLNTGHVGILVDDEWRGKGIRIAEMLPGSILSLADPDIKAGDVIVSVDGEEIPEGRPWYEVFSMKAGRKTMLGVDRNVKEKSGKEIVVHTTVYVTPTSSDDDALYRRWVRQREEIVRKLSKGKVGYVHVEGMDSESFREVYSKLLGKYRSCEAVVVDTRHNGGGWLHDDLATLLGGKAYIDYKPRGQYIGTDPYSKWTKPSCVLIGEDNYSDACGFPYVYRTLGIGKLIGAPVPGTMTAVWWERQIDPTLVFGIPQVTSWGRKEGRALENLQIEPDILVYNDPKSVEEGRDLQLEAAVKEMLKEIKNGKQ